MACPSVSKAFPIGYSLGRRWGRWLGVTACTLSLMGCGGSQPALELAPVPTAGGPASGDTGNAVASFDILQSGDVLRINVWRQPEFSGQFVIGPDGALVHPLYQDVHVGGLTLDEANGRLSTFLGTYLQNAHLVVEPLYPVTVAGEVRSPNLYHVARGTTIAQAIAQAGGPTPTGRLDRVVLQRGDSAVTISLMGEFTRWGTIPLGSGDQVFVERRSNFSIIRDVISPVTSVAVLALTVIRISQR